MNGHSHDSELKSGIRKASKQAASQRRSTAGASPRKREPWTTGPSVIEHNGNRYDASRYCDAGLPQRPLPDGYYLVHNHVRPTNFLNLNGFRAWVQKDRTCPKLIECKCDFGGMKNAKVNKHYSVKFEQEATPALDLRSHKGASGSG
jgi:hypothetical protein